MDTAWQALRVGDRIRLIAEPPEWRQPGYHAPPDTRRLVRRLIARGRPLRICEVDEWGVPWVRCRVRRRTGSWEQHFVAITEGGWVRVRKRN
jgi:hypothetical protein